MTAPIALRARYVFPVAGPPIPDGVITIHDGRIVAVGHESAVATPVDLGNAAIIPGLVNAHTHLEFSDLREPLGSPGTSFTDWIRAVIAYRRTRTADQRRSAASSGIAECSRAGTTLLGEIASGDWPQAVFHAAASQLNATVFLELLGLSAASVEANCESAEKHIASLPVPNPHRPSPISPGLSPHAPYTVHPRLLTAAIEISRLRKIPLAIHLAESPDEMELLRTGGGPLRELLEELSAWDSGAIAPGTRPLDYLRQLAEADRALVIHGNHLDDEEIAFVAERRERMSIVYCPRTHAYFGHSPYPLAKILSAGARVALGTDSRASNPDLDLLAEMRHVANHHPVSPATALAMATLHGAEALGQAESAGSITVGKFADLAIVRLRETRETDAYQLLLDPLARAETTVYRGCFSPQLFRR